MQRRRAKRRGETSLNCFERVEIGLGLRENSQRGDHENGEERKQKVENESRSLEELEGWNRGEKEKKGEEKVEEGRSGDEYR